MKLVNLGCGQRYHNDFINIDFESSNNNIISHNLLDGIPFPESYFEVVYHSHVLEHFTKEDGRLFLIECFRILKPKGIIRIVIPDLEVIIKNYLLYLEKSRQGDELAKLNYEWMLLELFDQMIRSKSGGGMADFLVKDELKNEEFIWSRIGEEGKQIRNNYLKRNNFNKGLLKKYNYFEKAKKTLKLSFFKHLFIKLLFAKDQKYITAGKFRLNGEIHQWMYDSYSLSELLKQIGFENISIKTAYDSSIPDWALYELDAKNGTIFKPDSLFIEAYKK